MSAQKQNGTPRRVFRRKSKAVRLPSATMTVTLQPHIPAICMIVCNVISQNMVMSATALQVVADRIIVLVLSLHRLKTGFFKSCEQIKHHALRVLHVGHDVADMVWRAILPVAVIAYP